MQESILILLGYRRLQLAADPQQQVPFGRVPLAPQRRRRRQKPLDVIGTFLCCTTIRPLLDGRAAIDARFCNVACQSGVHQHRCCDVAVWPANEMIYVVVLSDRNKIRNLWNSYANRIGRRFSGRTRRGTAGSRRRSQSRRRHHRRCTRLRRTRHQRNCGHKRETPQHSVYRHHPTRWQ